MTTTPEAIAAAIVGVIEALTPATEAGVKYREHRGDDGVPLDDWAEVEPDACFRRFEVRFSGDREQPEVSNTDVVSEERDFVVIVAYPTTARWGNPRKRDAVIDADAEQIDHAVGTESYAGGLLPATMLSQGSTRIDGSPVTLLVINLRSVGYRARVA